MANDINQCIFIGNLTRDTELKFLSNGTAILSGTIANNRKYGDQESTNYIDFKIWGKTAEAVNQYLLKGKKVCLAGEMRQENWEKDGQKHSKLVLNAQTVQLLSAKDDSTSPSKPATSSKPKPQASRSPQPQDFPGPEDFQDDSEIPF